MAKEYHGVPGSILAAEVAGRVIRRHKKGLPTIDVVCVPLSATDGCVWPVIPEGKEEAAVILDENSLRGLLTGADNLYTISENDSRFSDLRGGQHA